MDPEGSHLITSATLKGGLHLYSLLEGVRVIELATWTFVPAAGAVCADWGADVIKVEHPVTGDPQRGLFVAGLGSAAPDIMTQQPNRGKRSVALDVASPAGRDILLKMLQTADVFLTNVREGALTRLGLDPAELAATNPRLIYARGTGQGAKGPDANKGGYDLASGWARTGIAHRLTRATDAEPSPFPPAFVDAQAGLITAGAIALALYHRERTGEALVVDNSLFATGCWMLAPDILASEYDSQVLPDRPRADQANPIVNSYRTKDGRWLYLVLIESDRYWADLTRRIGRADLSTDPRFANHALRATNAHECIGVLDEVFADRTLDEWRDALDGLSGPWSPMQRPREVHDDPQASANGIFATARAGDREFKVVASPAQFGGHPLGDVKPAPEFGEHTDEVLKSLGFTEDEVIDLKIDNVIF